VKIARVVNLVRTLEDLKQRDLWCIGLDERGTMDYDQFDFSVVACWCWAVKEQGCMS